MDMNLSAEDIEFRDEVRKFLDENLTETMRTGLARTPGVFVEPDISLAWHKVLYKKGWITHGWPVEDGGMGWTPMQTYLYEKEVALAGAPKPAPISLQLIGPVLCKYGSTAQKERFIPRIRSGEDFWCQGYSEPGSGSDLASLSMRAVQDGDKYVLNGSKIWTTHAQHANWIFCLVRTDSSAKKQAGITFLLVPLDQPGIKVTPILSMSGDHEVNQVFFDNAETLLENRVGEEGQGWEIAKFLLQNERGGSCFAPKLLVNISKIEKYARNYMNGDGNSLRNDPDFESRLAKLKLRAHALEFTELRIQADIANGRPAGPQTSLTKLMSSNLAQEVQTLHNDLFAYEGLQLPSERPLYHDSAPTPIGSDAGQTSLAAYLNGRASTIYGGSDQVQKNIVAKRILQL
ncbi:acyl-CoA dehydrogenase family protein [bacterium]|nr:acyl-CoA dehydrogenase family protein [bacterium]